MVLVWCWYCFGMVLVWCWYGFGMVLVWFGTVLVWFWYRRLLCVCCSRSFPEDFRKRLGPGGPEPHEAQRPHRHIGMVLVWVGTVLLWFCYGFAMVFLWLCYVLVGMVLILFWYVLVCLGMVRYGV